MIVIFHMKSLQWALLNIQRRHPYALFVPEAFTRRIDVSTCSYAKRFALPLSQEELGLRRAGGAVPPVAADTVLTFNFSLK